MKMRVAIVITLALSACVPQGKATEGASAAEDYAAYCSGCHGATGKGDGEMARGLAKKPADLTHLSTRNRKNTGDESTRSVSVPVMTKANVVRRPCFLITTASTNCASRSHAYSIPMGHGCTRMMGV